jgi:hypothetical protein
MGTVEKLAQSIIDLFPILPKTVPYQLNKLQPLSVCWMTLAGLIVPVTIKYRMETS